MHSSHFRERLESYPRAGATHYWLVPFLLNVRETPVTTLTPSHFGLFRDSETFQLPIPGLFADIDDGAGSVALADEFLSLPGETRARILQQWSSAMSTHQDAAVVEMFHEFVVPLGGLSIVQQIERFRQHCVHLKIACPAKLALLLQRY